MILDLQKLFTSPKTILIIPAVNNDFDIICSCVALAYYLKQTNKIATIFSPFLADSSGMANAITNDEIHLSGSALTRKFQISIKPKIEINDLDYKVADHETVINILTGENSILRAENMSVSELRASFDLTIVVGTNNPENLGFLYEENKDLFVHDKYVLITDNIIQDKLFNVVLIDSNNYSSAVYNQLKSFKPFPEGACLTWLLAGIIWKTNNFRANYYNSLFLDISELISLGANYNVARQLNLKTAKTNITEIQKIIWMNFKSNENGLFWSFIPKTISCDEIIINNFLFGFAENAKCKVALIIVEKESYKQVYIKSNSKEINLKSLVISLGGKGSSSQGVFTTILSDIEVINTIQSALFTAKPEAVEEKALEEIPVATTNTAIPSESIDLAADPVRIPDFPAKNKASTERVAEPEPPPIPIPKTTTGSATSTVKPEDVHEVSERYDPLAPAKRTTDPLNMDNL